MFESQRVSGAANFESLAADWECLWRRSQNASPLASNRLLFEFSNAFFSNNAIAAYVVRHKGKIVAALPFIASSKMFRSARLAANEMGRWGEPIFDPAFPINTLADQLVDAMAGEQTWLWNLDWMDGSAEATKAIVDAAKRRGLFVAKRHQFCVGLIDLAGRSGDCLSRVSSSFRKKMRKNRRRLESVGPLRFEAHRQLHTSSLDTLLDQAIEIEDKSWKGQTGTSVRRTPGMRTFLTKVARQLLERRELMISFLYLGERPIAFEFGWIANKTYYSYKIGYDPEFASGSPGQVLTDELCRYFEGSEQADTLHTMGPISSATQKWSSRVIAHQNISISTDRAVSKLWAIWINRLKSIKARLHRVETPAIPSPGAKPVSLSPKCPLPMTVDNLSGLSSIPSPV